MYQLKFQNERTFHNAIQEGKEESVHRLYEEAYSKLLDEILTEERRFPNIIDGKD